MRAAALSSENNVVKKYDLKREKLLLFSNISVIISKKRVKSLFRVSDGVIPAGEVAEPCT